MSRTLFPCLFLSISGTNPGDFTALTYIAVTTIGLLSDSPDRLRWACPFWVLFSKNLHNSVPSHMGTLWFSQLMPISLYSRHCVGVSNSNLTIVRKTEPVLLFFLKLHFCKRLVMVLSLSITVGFQEMYNRFITITTMKTMTNNFPFSEIINSNR